MNLYALAMKQTERRQLAEFLAPATPGGRCHLYLPRFTDARIDLPQSSGGLRYPGGAYADRDTKAAMRVVALVGTVIAAGRVLLSDAAELVGRREFPGGFLFGSKSNPATPFFRSWFGLNHGFDFEFNREWTVVWEHADRFSIPDPSRLGRDEYEKQIDYGVVGRLTSGQSGAAAFVVAGLGGRATEGCGVYLAENWKRLHEKYGRSDFCVLIRFAPPIDPQRFEVLSETRL
jgi:hypothetical protein